MPIREMKEDDLPQVLALQRSLAFQDWNEKQFTAEIKAGGTGLSAPLPASK